MKGGSLQKFGLGNREAGAGQLYSPPNTTLPHFAPQNPNYKKKTPQRQTASAFQAACEDEAKTELFLARYDFAQKRINLFIQINRPRFFKKRLGFFFAHRFFQQFEFGQV